MSIISLNYIKPLSEVEKLIGEHRKLLERYYSCCIFLLSGRKEPRSGGIIFANSGKRSEIDEIVKKDPFHREQIASYEITEFIPSMSTAELSNQIEH